MSNTLFTDAWEAYEKSVLPEKVSETSRLVLRTTFYSGAWSLLTLIAKTANDQPTKATQKTVHAIFDEITEFAERGGTWPTNRESE